MIVNTDHTTSNNNTLTWLTGLPGLEQAVERDTFIYILRSLYHIVFQSSECNETQHQLQQRIQRFEEQSNLPAFLSSVPIALLLTQLEDAQFFYPICRHETTLPIFH